MNKFFAQQITRMKTQQFAWFGDTEFEDIGVYEGVRQIANALNTINSPLNQLSFDSTGILNYPDALESLLNAVKQRPNIQAISLQGRAKERVSWKSLNVITTMLRQNDNLDYFSLNYVELTSEMASRLATTLEENKALKTIDLDGNHFGNQGLQSLLSAIKSKRGFSLSCKNTLIDSEGAKMIAEFLNSGELLGCLYISENNIGSDGFEAIADALKRNHSIEALDIGSCTVTDKAAEDLAASLKENHLKHLVIRNAEIPPSAMKIIASALKENHSLERLDFTGSKIGDEGVRFLADGIKDNHTLKSICLGPDVTQDGFNLLLSNATPALNGVDKDFTGSEKSRFSELYSKMKNPESLSQGDLEQIRGDIFAIVQLQLYPKDGFRSYYGRASGEKLEEVARIVEPVRVKAQEIGIEIGMHNLLAGHLRKQNEDIKAAEARYIAEVTAPTKKELTKYAERNGLTLDSFVEAITEKNAVPALTAPIAGFLGGKPKLADLEALLEWNKTSPISDDPAHRTAKQFIAHSVIPHLDYFVMFAMKKEDLASVKPTDYPLIQTYGNGRYILNEEPFDRLEHPNAQIAKKAQTEVRPLDLASLRENVVAPHMDKMRDALAEVNDRLAGFELAHIEKLAEITSIVNTILAKEGRKAQVVQEREDVARDNRKLEREIKAANRVLEARKNDDKKRLTLSDADKAIYIAYEAAKGLPWVGDGLKAIMDMEDETAQGLIDVASDGTEDFGLVKAKDIRIRRSIARQAQRAQQDMIDKIKLMIGDVRKYDREIKQIEKLVGELVEKKDEKQQLTTATTQEAIRELFLARYILEHGMQNSRDIDEFCESNPKVGNIDTLLDTFDRKSRLGEALQNLCIGYADSNDLCVIMAEVNGFTPPLQPAQQVLHDFSEDLLKPNLGDFCSHASKMDFVYQVGLAGLGTSLHNGRKMVRDAYDQRLTTLFSDAFGVKTAATSLTVAGALDVQKLFGYYMERHGKKNTMSAARLLDGEVTDVNQRKAINVLPEDKESDFVENVKQSQELRRNSQPNVGDLFLRICGYEYFVPQAVNAAGKDNLMHENPEAPAAYPMANQVINQFIANMNMGSIGEYRGLVGQRVDNLIAQTFMDFFSELGGIHSQDPKLVTKREVLKRAYGKGENYGRSFDSYCNSITRDALSQYPLFLEIYAKNLEKQLAGLPAKDAKALREQIGNVRATCEALAPDVTEPGSAQAKLAAHNLNHSYENTHWRGGLE